MSREFLIVGALLKEMQERHYGLTEPQFLMKAQALAAAGEIESIGYRLIESKYAEPLALEAISVADWQGGKLVNTGFAPMLPGPKGWILKQGEESIWASVRIEKHGLIAAWEEEKIPVSRPKNYKTGPRFVAQQILAEIYGDRIPEIADAELIRSVGKVADKQRKTRPSGETILRAAGRKK